ncbi:hypothetical protein M911_13380 [Ectothiorhodospira haloalkaliphila]|uniref:ABC transporter substrate-binding protein n=2 Tax=Ectothiorhodospira haloalkaliphila TaxID=421628 RepID=W8KLD6_9GAMM|nr:hypothetical protein M911_13380 [Ectothiorhodospira haloalkaliphila]
MLTLVILAAGCGDARQADGDTLVVYSAGPRPLAEAVVSDWEASTGHRVELFAATTGQIMARLEAERYRPRADVVVFASALAAESLKQRGALLPYQPEGLNHTHEAWHDPDHHYVATSAAIVGVALRDGVGTVDLDWSELMSGQTGGRLTMPSPSRSGSAGEFVLAYKLHHGDRAWDDYLAMRRAGLEFSAANSQAIGGLLQGAYQAIVGAVDYLIYRQVDQGAPVRMHYPPSGSALVIRPVAILADTPVEDLAQSFVDHYLSLPMQEKVAAQHLLPARTDVPLSPARAGQGLPETFNIDTAEALEQYRDVLRRFQIQVERAEVVPAGGNNP